MKAMKRLFKWVGIVLLTPIALFIIICILLYIPPVQNFLVDKATRYASEATGMQIHIGRLSLSFPLDLVVHENAGNLPAGHHTGCQQADCQNSADAALQETGGTGRFRTEKCFSKHGPAYGRHAPERKTGGLLHRVTRRGPDSRNCHCQYDPAERC